MSKTRLFLDLRGKARDGKGPVLVWLEHRGQSTTVSTGVRILPSEWNGAEVINRDDSPALNVTIQEAKLKVDKLIASLSAEGILNELTASEIKQQLGETRLKPKQAPLISDMFSEFVSIKSDMSEGTKVIYQSALNRVIAYAGKDSRITDIDYKWLMGFEKFMSKTQCTNGRAIYLRHLRAVCNYARKTKRIIEYPFENFRIKLKPTLKKGVTVDTLRNFRDAVVSEKQSRYRDYFFLVFYLIGINIKDLLTARKEQVVRGRLEYIRCKTHKKYSIKIEPEAAALIEKYKGEKYLLDALDRCKLYTSYARALNDTVKTIGPVVMQTVQNQEDLFSEPEVEETIKPVIPNVTTYFARHTWATLAAEIGVPIDIISQALGHSSMNRTTLIYVKFDPRMVDNANRKVIDYLNGT